MIQAYQFIKYNSETSIEFLTKVYNTGAIICFDFEDGIINPFNEDLCKSFKDEAREHFNRTYSLIQNNYGFIKIGIRLNRYKSLDFVKDLAAIKGKKFESIFLPKVEESDDIKSIVMELDFNDISYKDLIPIVESKKGMNNLELILQANLKINKIAFGHCDYNLDNGIYPFFHQESWEYWKWISVLLVKTTANAVKVINSPYLGIYNNEFFGSMIDYLVTNEKFFHGQITLSTEQSSLCKNSNQNKINFKQYLENKNIVSASKEFAIDLIKEFETYNKFKGLSKSKNRLISLQEYRASKYFMNEERIVNELCFVGGCFPVQHNIVYENLFHQRLKRQIEDRYKNRLNVNIIRYELFSTLLEKIEILQKEKTLDLIIFHIRPEPYLRLSKLFYKYIDNKGKKRWSINMPIFNLIMSEKYDILNLGRRFQSKTKLPKKLFYSKILVSANYILGMIAGNKRNALKRYNLLTNEIVSFCNSKNIELIILGPNRRSNNGLEPLLCKDLDLYFSKKLINLNYISGFIENNINKMNHENGIHVTQFYHDLIADRLYEIIIMNKTLLSPTRCKANKGLSGVREFASRISFNTT